MKTIPTVGQRMFSLNIGNANRTREQSLTPVIVVKVGRKYFTVEVEGKSFLTTVYNLDTYYEHTDYSANSRLFETEQAWEDSKEEEQLCRDIEDAFNHGRNPRGVPLDQLRKVKKIIYRERE